MTIAMFDIDPRPCGYRSMGPHLTKPYFGGDNTKHVIDHYRFMCGFHSARLFMPDVMYPCKSVAVYLNCIRVLDIMQGNAEYELTSHCRENKHYATHSGFLLYLIMIMMKA